MAKRSRDWNEGLAKDMKTPAFARQFLQACLDEGLSLQLALSKVVKSFGVKEFSKKAGMADSNVLRSLDPKHNPTQETLNRLLKPLGLGLSIVPLIESIRHKKAA